MQSEIILVGGGGHCKACIDVIQLDNTYKIAGIIDLEEKRRQLVLGHRVIASDEALPELTRQYKNFLVTIGHIKGAHRRKEIYYNLKKWQASLPTIVSPLAYVSPHAMVGTGTIVMHNAIINSGAVVGENCIVNTRALIEHDAFIDDHCHVATGAVVNGGASIGSGTLIGSLTMIRENQTIGENCVIGAGQAVFKDIKNNTILRPKE